MYHAWQKCFFEIQRERENFHVLGGDKKRFCFGVRIHFRTKDEKLQPRYFRSGMNFELCELRHLLTNSASSTCLKREVNPHSSNNSPRKKWAYGREADKKFTYTYSKNRRSKKPHKFLCPLQITFFLNIKTIKLQTHVPNFSVHNNVVFFCVIKMNARVFQQKPLPLKKYSLHAAFLLLIILKLTDARMQNDKQKRYGSDVARGRRRRMVCCIFRSPLYIILLRAGTWEALCPTPLLSASQLQSSQGRTTNTHRRCKNTHSQKAAEYIVSLVVREERSKTYLSASAAPHRHLTWN